MMLLLFLLCWEGTFTMQAEAMQRVENSFSLSMDDDLVNQQDDYYKSILSRIQNIDNFENSDLMDDVDSKPDVQTPSEIKNQTQAQEKYETINKSQIENKEKDTQPEPPKRKSIFDIISNQGDVKKPQDFRFNQQDSNSDEKVIKNIQNVKIPNLSQLIQQFKQNQSPVELKAERPTEVSQLIQSDINLKMKSNTVDPGIFSAIQKFNEQNSFPRFKSVPFEQNPLPLPMEKPLLPPLQNNLPPPMENLLPPPMQNPVPPPMQNPVPPPMQNPVLPPMQNLLPPPMEYPVPPPMQNPLPPPMQNPLPPPMQNPLPPPMQNPLPPPMENPLTPPMQNPLPPPMQNPFPPSGGGNVDLGVLSAIKQFNQNQNRNNQPQSSPIQPTNQVPVKPTHSLLETGVLQTIINYNHEKQGPQVTQEIPVNTRMDEQNILQSIQISQMNQLNQLQHKAENKDVKQPSGDLGVLQAIQSYNQKKVDGEDKNDSDYQASMNSYMKGGAGAFLQQSNAEMLGVKIKESVNKTQDLKNRQNGTKLSDQNNSLDQLKTNQTMVEIKNQNNITVSDQKNYNNERFKQVEEKPNNNSLFEIIKQSIPVQDEKSQLTNQFQNSLNISQSNPQNTNQNQTNINQNDSNLGFNKTDQQSPLKKNNLMESLLAQFKQEPKIDLKKEKPLDSQILIQNEENLKPIETAQIKNQTQEMPQTKSSLVVDTLLAQLKQQSKIELKKEEPIISQISSQNESNQTNIQTQEIPQQKNTLMDSLLAQFSQQPKIELKKEAPIISKILSQNETNQTNNQTQEIPQQKNTLMDSLLAQFNQQPKIELKKEAPIISKISSQNESNQTNNQTQEKPKSKSSFVVDNLLAQLKQQSKIELKKEEPIISQISSQNESNQTNNQTQEIPQQKNTLMDSLLAQFSQQPKLELKKEKPLESLLVNNETSVESTVPKEKSLLDYLISQFDATQVKLPSEKVPKDFVLNPTLSTLNDTNKENGTAHTEINKIDKKIENLQIQSQDDSSLQSQIDKLQALESQLNTYTQPDKNKELKTQKQSELKIEQVEYKPIIEKKETDQLLQLISQFKSIKPLLKTESLVTEKKQSFSEQNQNDRQVAFDKLNHLESSQNSLNSQNSQNFLHKELPEEPIKSEKSQISENSIPKIDPNSDKKSQSQKENDDFDNRLKELKSQIEGPSLVEDKLKKEEQQDAKINIPEEDFSGFDILQLSFLQKDNKTKSQLELKKQREIEKLEKQRKQQKALEEFIQNEEKEKQEVQNWQIYQEMVPKFQIFE